MGVLEFRVGRKRLLESDSFQAGLGIYVCIAPSSGMRPSMYNPKLVCSPNACACINLVFSHLITCVYASANMMSTYVCIDIPECATVTMHVYYEAVLQTLQFEI